MEIIAILLALISLVTSIWLVTVAFKQSIPWGMGLIFGPALLAIPFVFFILPFTLVKLIILVIIVTIPYIVFSIKHWEVAQKPFTYYIASSVISMAITFPDLQTYFAATSDLQNTLQQIQQGTLPPEQGNQKMRETLKKLEQSDTLTEQQRETARKLQEMLNLAQSEQNSDTTPTNNDEKEQQHRLQSLERLRQKLAQRKEELKNHKQLDESTIEGTPIRYAAARKHLNSIVIVVTRSGNRHDGILKAIDTTNNQLVLEKPLSGGSFEFKIYKDDIKSIYLANDIPK